MEAPLRQASPWPAHCNCQRDLVQLQEPPPYQRKCTLTEQQQLQQQQAYQQPQKQQQQPPRQKYFNPRQQPPTASALATSLPTSCTSADASCHTQPHKWRTWSSLANGPRRPQGRGSAPSSTKNSKGWQVSHATLSHLLWFLFLAGALGGCSAAAVANSAASVAAAATVRTTTGSASVADAAVIEPVVAVGGETTPFQYRLDSRRLDSFAAEASAAVAAAATGLETETDVEDDVDIDVDIDAIDMVEPDEGLRGVGSGASNNGGSNEQQLLAFYQRAQEQLQRQRHLAAELQHKRREHGGAAGHQHHLMLEQQQQQQQQLRRHQRERDLDFDELLGPTAAVLVSTLAPTADLRSELLPRKGVTKRSATKIPATMATTTTPTTARATVTLASLAAESLGVHGDGIAMATAMPAGTKATATPSASGGGGSSTAAAEERCEPKTLEEVPAEPAYDLSFLAEEVARQLTDYLAKKLPTGATTGASAASAAVISTTSQQQQLLSGAATAAAPNAPAEKLREEARRHANGIASYALNSDENLLAFAIAAPTIHTVVVKFRDNVTIPPQEAHNKAFLGSYWRELGQAWNSTNNTQEWGAPFRDCNLLKGRWLWPFRYSFTENNIRVVAAGFIPADQDVCNDDLEQVFGRRHGCDRNTTFCLLMEEKPQPTRDIYNCICLDGYYVPNADLQGYAGDIVEMSEGHGNYSCLPCPGGCRMCDKDGHCLLGVVDDTVSLELLLKVFVGSVIGACIFCCVVLSVIVFRQRKSKAIAAGMWTVLETILLGIILLYASITVHFFPASTVRCLVEPWLRELGFITCYGAIILKLYRHLVDFRTRKAHRWVLRDVDLLKYLGTMVFAVICYMAAFTASAIDLLDVGQLQTLREATTNTCQPLTWDYVTQASEILMLCFGLHLAFASRNANTQFRERQFLVATLILEFLISGTFYLLRFFYLPEMNPSTILLALALRSQLTNTIALCLIFMPKLWYQHRQVRSLAHDLSIRLPVDAFKGPHDAGQRLGGGYAGLCLGDPDIGELTISEMNPEDIRAELKRLYTQLEILKNKTLRQDNPHISKRRGGRKVGHRRFSLQKKGSKDKALSAKHRSNKHHQDIEITEAEPSRTPEDSVCSVEGPTDTYAEISGISHSMYSHSVVSHSK